MIFSLSRRLVVLAILLAPTFVFASEAAFPKVIRLGLPVQGTGNRPIPAESYFGNVQMKGLLEEEFKKEGIKIEWNNFKGASAAVNEAVVNGLLDVFLQNDMVGEIARSNGLKSKVILADNRLMITSLAVPVDSKARSFEDLKGKKIGAPKGAHSQLSFMRLIDAHGMKESDFKIINMMFEGLAALATKDIDAMPFPTTILYGLESRGVAKIISSRKDETDSRTLGSGKSVIVVTDDFEKKYPEVLQRIVNVLVREAAWVGDAKNRDQVLKEWAKSGYPLAAFQRQYEGIDFKVTLSPLLDGDYQAGLQATADDLLKFKMLRNKVDVPGWIDDKYLKAALKANGLENYWTPVDANGKPQK